MSPALRIGIGAAGAALGCYAGYAVAAYTRYGKQRSRTDSSSLIDRCLPDYEVRDVHQTSVHAPAHVTMRVARAFSLQDSPIVRLIFALRAVPSRLSGAPAPASKRQPLLEEVRALGWRVLAEVPGRQLVMGAVTQPWKANVEFRGLSPEVFATFDEPGYAKIAWTFEAYPRGPASSLFRTETRVATTDPDSREKFRRYWSMLSPGIKFIRREGLRLIRSRSESKAQELSGSRVRR